MTKLFHFAFLYFFFFPDQKFVVTTNYTFISQEAVVSNCSFSSGDALFEELESTAASLNRVTAI